MRVEVRPGTRGASWVWRVWHNSREIAFGISPSEADANEQAQKAVDARSRRLGYSWEIGRSRGEYER